MITHNEHGAPFSLSAVRGHIGYVGELITKSN